MTETGTFLIADISGYTEFLIRSGLDHGPVIATDLITRIVDSIRPAFVVNKIEGDAVFAVSDDSRPGVSDLLDLIDATYATFLRRLTSVGQATSCGCNACGLLPRLDLKLIAHHGTFDRQSIAGRGELVGQDVILTHRLLKNSLGFAGAGSGYVLLTDECVARFGIDPVAQGLAPHQESYPHLGEIRCWVGNLQHRLQTRPGWQSSTPLIHETRVVIAARPEELWDALVPGRSDSCVTHRLSSIHEIIEWNPYTRVVAEVKAPEARMFHEIVLDPTGHGTRTTIRWFRGRRQPGAPPWEAIGTKLAEMTTTALEDIGSRFAASV